MIKKVYKAEGLGKINLPWLKGHYVFSFSNFYDPSRMGVGPLIVLNDDHIAAQSGFPTHPHHNMEIITVVLEGELSHRDSTGGVGVLRPGDIQVMTAGRGIAHSEMNAHPTQGVHSLQIWIRPNHMELEPRYRDYKVGVPERGECLQLIGVDDRKIDRDVSIWRARLDREYPVEAQALQVKRDLFIYVIDGDMKIRDQSFKKGDAVVLEASELSEGIKSENTADLIIFEMDQSV